MGKISGLFQIKPAVGQAGELTLYVCFLKSSFYALSNPTANKFNKKTNEVLN